MAKPREDGWLKHIERGWEREMRRKRSKADEKGAAAELEKAIAKLQVRLPGPWEPSASRDELEVTASFTRLIIRVRRRNRNRGRKRWRGTAWTMGPKDGLLIARSVADDADGALADVLDQVAKLWEGLGEVLAVEGQP
jgi:hypothetical protein